MARNENFRKISTTLFDHRAADAGDWSGVLDDHKNLVNHQIYIVASAPIPNGSFRLNLLPDTDSNIPHTVGTSRLLEFVQEPQSFFDLPYKDSSFLYFTGVLGGIHLTVHEDFPPDITMSAVLTSYSNLRQYGPTEERFDYVSSTIFENKPSDDLTTFSLNTPDHLNMVYHQMMIISDTPVSGTVRYRVRVVPDSDEQLESTVDIGQVLFFPTDGLSSFGQFGPVGGDDQSFILWFGGVFKGIHLQAIEDIGIGPEDGHLYTAILSSSVERFDQTVRQFIGDLSPGMNDHINDFDNPHMTSWDNLLDKPDFGITDWPVIKEFIAVDEEHTIPTDFQMLVWNTFDIEGTLTVDGTLVILDDQPVTPPTGPAFTYSGDDLSQVDYDEGEQKLFTYNGGGDLERLDFIQDGVTLRKDFFYTGGGDLDFINEYYV
jgi:hypothetical protein